MVVDRKKISISILVAVLLAGFITYLTIETGWFSQKLTYGIALGYTLPVMNHDDRVAELNHIKQLGFQDVRYNIDWSAVQPDNGTSYDWQLFDSVLSDVKQSGLLSIVTLDRTPMWDRPAGCASSIFCAPVHPEDFARFAAAAVQRYRGDHVKAWEIWNEPNIVNFWKPAPDPAAYTKLLSAAYTAIKQQDHSAVVLIGGLSGDAEDSGPGYIDSRTFLGAMYSSGAKPYFDGIAFHPYTGLRLPDTPGAYNGWPKMSTTNPSIRGILIAHGDATKGIWITEFGVPTDGSGAEAGIGNAQKTKGADHVSLDFQKQIAQAAITDIKKMPWIKDFDWYTYIDGAGTGGGSGSYYGLLFNNGQTKPAYQALQPALK